MQRAKGYYASTYLLSLFLSFSFVCKHTHIHNLFLFCSSFYCLFLFYFILLLCNTVTYSLLFHFIILLIFLIFFLFLLVSPVGFVSLTFFFSKMKLFLWHEVFTAEKERENKNIMILFFSEMNSEFKTNTVSYIFISDSIICKFNVFIFSGN